MLNISAVLSYNFRNIDPHVCDHSPAYILRNFITHSKNYDPQFHDRCCFSWEYLFLKGFPKEKVTGVNVRITKWPILFTSMTSGISMGNHSSADPIMRKVENHVRCVWCRPIWHEPQGISRQTSSEKLRHKRRVIFRQCSFGPVRSLVYWREKSNISRYRYTTHLPPNISMKYCTHTNNRYIHCLSFQLGYHFVCHLVLHFLVKSSKTKTLYAPLCAQIFYFQALFYNTLLSCEK